MHYVIFLSGSNCVKRKFDKPKKVNAPCDVSISMFPCILFNHESIYFFHVAETSMFPNNSAAVQLSCAVTVVFWNPWNVLYYSSRERSTLHRT